MISRLERLKRYLLDTNETWKLQITLKGLVMITAEEFTHRCLPEGFKEIEEWADGMYRRVWVSDENLMVLSYCEGDIILTAHATREAYQNELAEADRFYEEH